MSAQPGSGAAFGGSAVPAIAGLDQNVTGDINVTPMIDVMLVLLIIFMVITPALAGYVVQLPDALTATSEKEDRVTLGITIDGRYYIDETGQAVRPADLAGQLRAAYATRPDDHVLYLKADQAVSYDVVLTAIDAARQAGVRRIGAITETAQGGATEERR